MQITEAHNLATKYMNEHNLSDWKFVIKNTIRTLGQCNHTKRTISLSSLHIYFSKYEGIRDTILHEIAHALVGHSHHHDKIWRDKFIAIGGSGQRCSKSIGIYKYDVECSYCNRIIGQNDRKLTRKNAYCDYCLCTILRYKLTPGFAEYKAWLKNNRKVK